jgi:PAS domain S-box-containing protein
MSLLSEEGYQVQPADSGRLALFSVAAQPPDLILLDLRMPGMDGFEVCRLLKESEEGRRVPVIFLSASRETEDWVEALALGAVDFVSKPFRREELLARVRTHVELGRLRADLELRAAQRTAELRAAIEQLQLEVAERRRAEHAVRESEQRFRLIANAAPVIIWMSGPDHNVVFRNEHTEQFSGRSASELADFWSTEVVHPGDLENQQRVWRESMQAREAFELEYRIRRADGEFRHMMERGVPRFLPDGGFAGYVGILVDLTDIKRSQERAFEARSLENLRVLSAGIAHDFNTLIGAIFGEADLALSDMATDAPGRESVENIVRAAQRAAEIVRLLAVYAGDRSDRSQPELTNLSSVLQEIVPHLKVSILRQADIRTSLDPHLPSVWANGQQIRQVMLNIIMNAVEALDGNKGVVTVATSAIRRPDGHFVKLQVADTGSGMCEETRARIFDPYYSTKLMGRGLGLAAVQGIIHSHGGVVTATSTPGGGATFEVLLPVAR